MSESLAQEMNNRIPFRKLRPISGEVCAIRRGTAAVSLSLICGALLALNIPTQKGVWCVHCSAYGSVTTEHPAPPRATAFMCETTK
ncbi:hypothetical protein J6590_067757 [Homalodisca vitripennis]|nr:hypothetical protein J6590_067757 [Homalodisca vitripennis]